ncbi:MAG: alpha/beta hydrolase-fold protein [Myxococcota bacterium]
MGSELVRGEVESDLVPSPVAYAALVPEGKDQKDLPLVLNLHGGGGSRQNLVRQKPLWDRLWAQGTIPPMVVVTPSVTRRGFYMNFKDGSEKWEDFIIGPLLDHLRKQYPVTQDPKRTFLMGASMGGMGSLRIAFRYPERFGAVAALEPGIEPILQWSEMKPKHRFWRSDELFERAYGKPVDPEYWAANNPATMLTRDEQRIRESGLQVYIEAGDEDQFWLYEGTEFLHRVLWDHKVKHEYHLVRGADHVGASMGERLSEAVAFLVRSYQPWESPGFVVRAIVRRVERQKRGLEERDHYHVPE